MSFGLRGISYLLASDASVQDCKACGGWFLVCLLKYMVLISVVDPDPDPYGSVSFGRIQSRMVI